MSISKSTIVSLPPGLTLIEVSKRLGVNYQASRNAVLRHRYKFTDGRKFSQNKTRKIIPEDIDWSRSNIEIARRLLVSRERIRFVRHKLGKPRVESRGRPRKCEQHVNKSRKKIVDGVGGFVKK